MAKPAILIVPAAMHSPAHYQGLTRALNSMGYSVLSDKVPSLDPKGGTFPTVAQDAEHFRSTVLLPELDQGREVIVLGHSYGGCVGPAAAKGLGKSERRAVGEKGGVIGLVNMSAAVIAGGKTLLSMFPNGTIPAGLVVDEATRTFMVEDAKNYYKAVPQLVGDEAASQLRPHAVSVFETPVPEQAWTDAAFDGRRAYIKTLADESVGPEAQQAMLEASGVQWRVLDLADAGHFPNLTHAREVARFVDELATDWTGMEGV